MSIFKKTYMKYFVLIFTIVLVQKTLYSTKKITKQKNVIANIFLNFENASLSSVVNYLSEEKKINIIPNKNLDSIKVSLSTKTALTLEKAWNILLTLLEINGYTIINVDNLYRIIPKQLNKQEPLPIYSDTMLSKLPESDELIRYIYFLKNIKANMVRDFLATMLEGTIQINEDLDALIITDRSLSIKSSMKIIEELDQGGLRESIKIIKLHHAIADDVYKLFEKIMPKEQQKNIRFLGPQKGKKNTTFFSKDTKIIPETRQNSLILLGIEKNIDKIIKFIYKYIDIPVDSAESRLHIKELKYAKAETVSSILKNILKPPAGLPKSVQVGEYKFFEDVIIVADSSPGENGSGGGNRLIISCGRDDWKRIEKLINSIDKPQPQVAFEVLIVDVGLTSNYDLFAQFKPKKFGMFGKHVDPHFETALGSKNIDILYSSNLIVDEGDPAIPSIPGIPSPPDTLQEAVREGVAGANMTFGLPGNLWGMIKAVLSKTNYNIIMQPYITVNNNQECIIDSSQERQVDSEFSSKTLASSLVQQKKKSTATTKVTLTPKVNLNGTIDLKIKIEIGEFTKTLQTSPDQTSRDLDTRINIGTGEVIVLGGLTKSKHTETTYKVPILGDIPIIGNLFKSRQKLRTKENLYIFIRPSIIKPRFEGVPDEYTQMKLDYAKHQILKHDAYSREKDPIQRWYFKPEKQSVRQKLSDAKQGIFRPIDNYASGFNQPKSVNIKNDEYFRKKQNDTKKNKLLVKNKRRRSKKSRIKKS